MEECESRPVEAERPGSGARSSRWGLAGLWTLLFLALIAIVERVIEYIDDQELHEHTHVLNWGTLRAISLEEARPRRSIKWVPGGDFYDYSDGYLERREYTYDVDENGYLMPSAIHAIADVTIIFQGGSTTEIVFVDPEIRFAYLTGRLIEQRTGLKVNSLNAGVSGSCTLDSINSLLNKHIAFDPDFVVMMEDINDLNTLIYNHNSYYGKVRNPIIEIPQRPGRRKRLVGKSLEELALAIASATVPHLSSRVSSLITTFSHRGESIDEFGKVRNEDRSVDPEVIRASFRRNVTLYVQAVRVFGIKPVLMTQASRFYDSAPGWRNFVESEIEKKTGLPFNSYRELHRSLNEVIREVGKIEDVVVIDLEKRIPGRSEFIHDPVHFNNNGSRLAAQIISDELIRHYFQN